MERGVEHQLARSRFHHRWELDTEPTLEIASGDVVEFDLEMAGAEQIHEGDRYEDTTFDFDSIYRLLGPVFVAGARPGDTLRVDVVELTPGEWGWCGTEPGLGLLPEDFTEGFVKTFDLRDGRTARICPQVTVPLAPFLGTMGTQPDAPASAASFPPHKGGGNVDTRHLTAGSTLWLPIWCEGALFSCGDPHGAQGDGEVCLAALECDMRARLRFTVEQRTISAPRFQTPGALTPLVDSCGHHGAMGIGPDLMEGARAAVRDTIAWLVEEHGLSREDAYVTCSLAGDLKLLEVVDGGMWNVGFTLPLSILHTG
jgi:acetamidase/formamidase